MLVLSLDVSNCSWRKPRRVVSGFRISCATPAASCPTVVSFSDLRSSSSILLRLVMSRVMLAMARIAPCLSRIGEVVTLTDINSPLFVTRTVSRAFSRLPDLSCSIVCCSSVCSCSGTSGSACPIASSEL